MGQKRKLESQNQNAHCVGPLSECPFFRRRSLRFKRRREENPPTFFEEFYHSSQITRTLNNRFELQRVISRGGFGIVFRAKDTQQDNEVAVKVMDDSSESHADGVQEALTLQRINQLDPEEKKYCVRLLHSFCHCGRICLVFEELGPTVAKFSHCIRDQPYSVEEVQHIGYQVCCAIGFLHEHDLVHNDVKPENIAFVNKNLCATSTLKADNFDIRLIDFGSVTRPHETRDVARTSSFSSPEYLIDGQSGFSYDVWSIGCTLFEMYTGKLLFGAAETHIEHLALIEKVCGRYPPSLISIDPDIFRPNGTIKLDGRTKSGRKIRSFTTLEKLQKTPKQEEKAFFELLKLMLHTDPDERLSINDLLGHACFRGYSREENSNGNRATKGSSAVD